MARQILLQIYDEIYKKLDKGKQHILTHLCIVEFHPQETPQMEKARQQELRVDLSAAAIPSFSYEIQKENY